MSRHATATLNGKVVAEADQWETVEGNIYVSLAEINPVAVTDPSSVPAVVSHAHNHLSRVAGMKKSWYRF